MDVLPRTDGPRLASSEFTAVREVPLNSDPGKSSNDAQAVWSHSLVIELISLGQIIQAGVTVSVNTVPSVIDGELAPSISSGSSSGPMIQRDMGLVT